MPAEMFESSRDMIENFKAQIETGKPINPTLGSFMAPDDKIMPPMYMNGEIFGWPLLKDTLYDITKDGRTYTVKLMQVD